jgi:hypothetical protein
MEDEMDEIEEWFRDFVDGCSNKGVRIHFSTAEMG